MICIVVILLYQRFGAILMSRHYFLYYFACKIKRVRQFYWWESWVNYYDFLTKAEHADCNAAVKKIYGRIDLEGINHIIEETPYISGLQKAFYKQYIEARISFILAPAYEMLW